MCNIIVNGNKINITNKIYEIIGEKDIIFEINREFLIVNNSAFYEISEENLSLLKDDIFELALLQIIKDYFNEPFAYFTIIKLVNSKKETKKILDGKGICYLINNDDIIIKFF